MGKNLFSFLLTDEPYRTIAHYFGTTGETTLTPQDSETRLLLDDIPIITAAEASHPEYLPAARSLFLGRDGSLWVRAATEEEVLIHIAVGRFALFVHFFTLMLRKRRTGTLSETERRTASALVATLPAIPPVPHLMENLADNQHATAAIVEAGTALVTAGLVDAIFGNISCRIGDSLIITRTGTALDRLAGGLTICPLSADDGTPYGASVEYPSHRRIVLETSYRCILHAHPRWTVITSLTEEAPTLWDIPVVEGTPGAELAAVIPAAVKEHSAAIVRGHGIFAAGRLDFNEPFTLIYRIERAAFATACAAFS